MMKMNPKTFLGWFEKNINNSRLEKSKLIINKKVREMFVLREDLIHPIASGNKLRKLKYNLLQSELENCTGIISYGGAYSNHLLACASLAMELGIPVILYVRGDELNVHSNGVLSKCHELGAKLCFISRSEYKERKLTSGIVDYHGKIFWSIPEGGANEFGVQGCKEIASNLHDFNNVVLSVGTATTLLGVLSGLNPNTKLYYSPIVDNWDMNTHLRKYFNFQGQTTNLIQIPNVHPERFGKISPSIREFVETFNNENEMQLDPLYTGKTLYDFFTAYDSVKAIDLSKTVFIHTGGINQKYW